MNLRDFMRLCESTPLALACRMRIAPRLIHVASLLLATGYGVVACGGTTTDDTENGPGDSGSPSDASTDGKGDEPITACGGCGCGGADTGAPQTVDLTADQACALLAANYAIDDFALGPECQKYCTAGLECQIPYGYVASVQGLNPDAGAPPDDGGARDLTCPTDAGTVTITCFTNCTGRLTEGFAAPKRERAAHATDLRATGERFAAMAFLEAVSIHAFERLENELAAHGADPNLLRHARRARRDEIRHTAMTARLAKKRGAEVRLPDAPQTQVTRSLYAMALENAVEGCVRETYGAVQGLVESESSPDAEVRRAMKSIADDECRHAELAWSVHAWAKARLSRAEIRRIEIAMKKAVEEIAGADPMAARLLFAS